MHLTRRKLLVGAPAAAVGATTWGVGIEPGRLGVTHHQVAVPGLPRGLAGLRIAQLTDVHLTRVHAAARAAAEAIAELQPEVVVLTGDIVQDPADLAELAAWAPEVRGTLATLATLGNWEHWGGVGAAELARAYHRAGVQLLVDETARVRRGGGVLGLVGLEDPDAGPRPEHAHRGAEGVDALAWLVHQPGYMDEVADLAPDLPRPHLALAGHTHGGQVRHPWGPLVTPPGSGRFVAGWYPDTWGPLYVSRGVGTSLAPVRLLCPPELAVFELVAG